MAYDPVNVGTTADDGTGDPIRTAFTKINEGFAYVIGLFAGKLDKAGGIMTGAIGMGGQRITNLPEPDGTDQPARVQELNDLEDELRGTYGSNANGRWEIRPSGVVEMWGHIAGSFGEGVQTITFPIEFPTACHNVLANASNDTASVTRDAGIQPDPGSFTTASADVLIQMMNDDATNISGFYWRAIGR